MFGLIFNGALILNKRISIIFKILLIIANKLMNILSFQSTVYKAVRKNTKEIVAIKKMEVDAVSC